MNTFQDLLRHLWIIRLTLFIGTLGITPVLPGMTVELEQLTSDPSAYRNSSVCVTGVTEGDGINFVLFRPPHRQANRTILVVNKQEGQRYNPVDGHWATICGTVTADERGIFACKLILETAETVQKRPVAGRRTFGVFENTGPETVEIETINDAGDSSAIMTLRPGDITKTVITPGKAKIFALSNDLSRTRLLSTFTLPTVKSSANYFERSTRTFYFRLRAGTMSLLKRDKATEMRKRWEALEQNENN
jgi:hypothetical protein